MDRLRNCDVRPELARTAPTNLKVARAGDRTSGFEALSRPVTKLAGSFLVRPDLVAGAFENRAQFALPDSERRQDL